MKTKSIICLLLLLGYFSATKSFAQEIIEQGKLILYKYQLPMGAETYQISSEGKALSLKTNFNLSFVGGKVSVTTDLRVRKTDYRPILFESKGTTSTRTEIDTKIEVSDNKATIQTGSNVKEEKISGNFFTISHPAPIAPQMMLFRYWQRNKIKDNLAVLPGGNTKIKFLGEDKITISGKPETLSRYCIEGVMWGCETVWFDQKQNLVALVGADAEMDRFEAIKEGYESLLSFFVAKGAEDAVNQLKELSRQVKPLEQDKFAIVGAILIDGNGGEPLPNSVVLIENGRIKTVGKQTEVKIPDNFRVVNAQGKSILPGLWDTHAHATQAEWFPASLAAGITTMRDAANEFEFIVPIRDSIKAGQITVAPRLLLAGYIDSGADALGSMKAETPEESRKIVNDYHR
ncbi:MAG TPA: hypothetical protein PKY82_34580, partial [Pyrinomonadaceae bacterium]|nr:hypothetical protein [Pyrinomonadaceae bacterium]